MGCDGVAVPRSGIVRNMDLDIMSPHFTFTVVGWVTLVDVVVAAACVDCAG